MVMNKENNHLISAIELKKKLNNKKVKILDARWFLEDSQKGRRLYDKQHIPQAIFFDINNLSDKTSDLPHMLPKKEIFKKYLDENGISKEDEIIVYDQIGFFSSARVWFTFKYFSFNKVKILNEGFLMWQKKNYPTENTIHKKKTINNKLTENKDLLENKAFIKKNIKNKNILIIDARSRKRFLGIEKEPRKNLKSGNIPGSINIPYSLLSKNGKFLNYKDLSKVFNTELSLKKQKIICSCGSGITACNLIFALNILGYNNVKLYDGSWAEWGKK